MTASINDPIDNRERAIQLAGELGSVTEAARQTGISRTQLYVWRERFAREGRTGLCDRKPVARNHPHHLPENVVSRILGYALAHPNMGAHRLAAFLKDKVGIDVHGVTVQRILSRHDLRYRHDRIARVEELIRQGKVHPDQALIEEVGRLDPKFRIYSKIGTAPGEKMVIDSAIAADFPETLGRTYVLVCIDTFSAYAWARLSSERTPEAVLDLFYRQVKPQLEVWGFTLGSVEMAFDPRFSKPTPSERTQFGHVHLLREIDPFPYTVCNKLDGRRNGMVECFLDQIRRELLRPVFLAHPEHAEDGAGMQTRTQDWVIDYNHRSLDGYPTWGRAPIRIVEEAREQMEEGAATVD